MFVTTLTRAGSAMRLASRRVWRRQLRRDLIQHLEPVAKFVRVLMIIVAITLLAMTPDGLKPRQTTQPCRIPDPPLQVGATKPHPEADCFCAAMMTIAAQRPRIEPPDEDDDLAGPMLPLARRIAALERMLANPWPAIGRLARRTASIPRGHFSAPGPAASAPRAEPKIADPCPGPSPLPVQTESAS
jgi:hypothetical protein